MQRTLNQIWRYHDVRASTINELDRDFSRLARPVDAMLCTHDMNELAFDAPAYIWRIAFALIFRYRLFQSVGDQLGNHACSPTTSRSTFKKVIVATATASGVTLHFTSEIIESNWPLASNTFVPAAVPSLTMRSLFALLTMAVLCCKSERS